MRHQPANLCTRFLDASHQKGHPQGHRLEVLRSLDLATVLLVEGWVAMAQKHWIPTPWPAPSSLERVPCLPGNDASLLALPCPVLCLEQAPRPGQKVRGATLLVEVNANHQPDRTKAWSGSWVKCFGDAKQEALRRLGGVLVVGISLDPSSDQWAIDLGASVLPIGVDAWPMTNEQLLWSSPRGMVHTVGLTVEVVPMVPSALVFMQHQESDGGQALREGMRREAMLTLGPALTHLAALACHGTRMKTIAAPEKVNQKRVKANKFPFYPYATLVNDNGSALDGVPCQGADGLWRMSDEPALV